jgi:hypothetical protein
VVVLEKSNPVISLILPVDVLFQLTSDVAVYIQDLLKHNQCQMSKYS